MVLLAEEADVEVLSVPYIQCTNPSVWIVIVCCSSFTFIFVMRGAFPCPVPAGS